MARTETWLAAGVIVVSNLAALGTVALDRRGVPEATLVMTERELPLPPRQVENTALTLRLKWIDAPDREGTVQWFDRARLEELGFDCSAPLEGDHLERYRSAAPRSAYAVLEYEGGAWERYRKLLESDLAREGEAPAPVPPPAPGRSSPTRSLAEERLAGSRLVVVDAGSDREALRRRHPDRARSVVVPATVRLVVVERPGQPPYLAGRVVLVYPGELNVPSSLRSVLEPLREDRRVARAGVPRYTVTVRWGRRAPWISGVDRIKATD